jgi:hypothetical protein
VLCAGLTVVLCCVVWWCEQEMSLARNWVMEEDGRWRRLIIEGEEEKTKKFFTAWVIKGRTGIIIVPDDVVKKILGYRMVRSVHCPLSAVCCPLPTVPLSRCPAVHCPLYAVHCLMSRCPAVPLSTVRCPLSTVRCTLYAVHCPLSRCPAVHCLLSAVRCPACPLSAVRCALSAVRCPLYAVRCTLSTARCPLCAVH